MEIGWVHELGSGVRNITKYNKIYSGVEPIFIKEDVFKTIIPLDFKGAEQVTEQANDEISRLLEFCKVPRARKEMQEFLKLHHREYFRTKFLNPLIKLSTVSSMYYRFDANIETRKKAINIWTSNIRDYSPNQ